MKKYKHTLLTLLYLTIFLVSGYKLFMYFYTYYETNRSLEEIQAIYKPVKEIVTNEHHIRQQFEQLQAINEDIVGWVTLDGTKLDNPILQAQDNEAYLEHNYKGNFSRAGSLFMDYRNKIDGPNYNTIIYGHAMRNGTMFGDLHLYADETYAREHPTIYYDTMYEGYTVEVFAAYETHISFDYIKTDFANEIDYATFLQDIKAKSVIPALTEVTVEDEIITLSTCSSRTFYGDERFVVHGKLVKR